MAEPMGFLNSDGSKEPRSPVPWAIAGTVVALVVAGMLIFGRKPAVVNPGGAGLAAADP